MNSRMTDYPRTFSAYTVLFLIAVLLTFLPACADDIPTSVIGRYDDWDIEYAPTVGMGIFPPVTLEPKDDDGTTATTIRTSTGSGIWVTISPFSATLSGQVTNIIVGYLSGDRNGATITISRRGESDDNFSDITTIKPDENGLFAWAVPASRSNSGLFRVVARSGTTQVLSNAIRFTAGDEEPVINPVVSPSDNDIMMVSYDSSDSYDEYDDYDADEELVVSPGETTLMATTPTAIPTKVPTTTSDSSGFGLSRLTISASSTTPAVGDDVTISGRLTDQNGKGISGATVSIDETGYPGATQAEPFDSTQTGSDGRFSFTIHVSFANSVGLVAHYDGDTTHSSAESNTIIFRSHS